MDYVELPVPETLADPVKCIWRLHGEGSSGTEASEPILPDGCAELILNRGAPFAELEAGVWHVQPERFLHGQLTKALQLRPRGACDIIGVRMRPHGVYALFGAHAVSVDRKVVLRDLDAGLDNIFRRALTVDDPETRLATVLHVLHERPRIPVERAVLDLVDELQHASDENKLGTLKAKAPLSARQLERRFLAVVGLQPKIFARIIRLRRLIEHIQADGGASFTALAHAAGYYDQAHFNRDLKAFTGLAPRAYFGQDLVLPPYFSGVH